MKDNTAFHDGIRSTLHALSLMLYKASMDANSAHAYMRDNERNTAIGTLLGVDETLERALALYRAVLAMHRYMR